MFTLILISLVTFLFFIYSKHRQTYWQRKGVKGPKPYPLIGTLLAENSLPCDELELKFYNEYGEVFGTYLGNQPVFNTCNYEHIKQILSNLHLFPAKSVVEFTDDYRKHSILFKSGTDWKTVRAAQTHYFTSKKLRNLFSHFEKCVNNFLDNVDSVKKESKNDDIEIKSLSTYYSLDCILKILFALEINSYREQNTKFIQSALHIGDINFLHGILMSILPRSVTNFFKLSVFKNDAPMHLGRYFEKLIKDRRKSGIKYNDLSELLQEAADNKTAELTDIGVIANCLIAFFAGAESVGNAASQMLLFLSKHEEVQEKLYEEIKKEFSNEIDYEKLNQSPYLNAVVMESIRLGNSFFSLARRCAEDVKLGEYFLEKGTEINVILYTAHQNNNYYQNPREFCPERWLDDSPDDIKNKPGNLFVGFGLGPKQCLGMRLALIELKYLAVRVMQNWKLSKPDVDKIKTTYFRSFCLRKNINIKFTRR